MKKKEKRIKEKKRKHSIFTWLLAIFLGLGIIGVTCLLVFALYIIISAPDFEQKKLYSKEATVLYYNDGSEITRMGRQNRVLVSYEELPQVLINAIIATEDSRFFQHTGMDMARFIKATIGQLSGNSKAGGASTLTMQVIKQTYTSGEDEGIKGIIRKFTDIYMSIFKLESNYTKEEIIEFYVNSIEFGNDGNLNYEVIAGIEQASQYYFGKSVSEITLAEASIIAGMFQSPTRYNPYRNPEGVKNRQNIVLKLMVQHGYITEEEKDAVQRIPIESLLRDRTNEETKEHQVIIDYVVSEVEQNTGLDPISTPMEIYTTIDPKVQDVLSKLENGEIYEFPNEFMQEGIAITSIEDGSIVALSGGRKYEARGTNRAVDISRHPGSTAKILFDYGPYIEYLNGSTYSMFLDEPTTYSNGTSIKNADNSYRGLMTMRSALASSRNIPALRAFQAVNKENKKYIENFVHSLGINYGKDLFEAAAIGGFDGVSPLEMSAAYAAFGRGGYYIEPYAYTKITILENGQTIEHKYEKQKVMSAETAYMITDILITAAKSGVGGVSVKDTEIAAKSGTTTIDRQATIDKGIPTTATMDAWNITYNSEYAIALWIGYDVLRSDYYLTSTIGGNVRNAVMKAIGTRIYSQNKTFTKPKSVIKVAVELETFPPQLPSEYTPSDMITYELFKEGTEPTEISTRYSKLENPTNGSYTFNGIELKLTWNPIATPEPIDYTTLQEHFNTYYENQASNYFNRRITYNNQYIGNLGYNIYKKDSLGNLIYVGRTENNNFTFTYPENGNITYIVKSAYSIFSANMSDGLAINTNTTIDSNIDDLITPPVEEPNIDEDAALD
ncbi:MAG: hypothetical protein E7172_00305 [Firmicutes bacterium]|nr:hypothetical protein [Bacillota bacterium]